MKSEKQMIEQEQTTEEKILEAASELFLQKRDLQEPEPEILPKKQE